MSHVTVLLPGLCDRALHDLGGVTPLEKAVTPFFAACIQEPFSPPESGGLETALLSLLGITPEKVALGPLQAAALGFRLAPHQFAYSLRLLSAGEGAIVDVSDTLTSDSEGKSFCQALNQVGGGTALHAQGPCGVWITDEEGEPNAGLNPIDLLERPWKPLLPLPGMADPMEEALASHEINALREDLEERPINGVLLTDGGTQQTWQLEGSPPTLIASSPLLRGVGKCCGMEVRQPPKEKKRLDSLPWILSQMRHAEEEMIVEIPHLWQSTYEGNLREKVKTIEYLDAHLLEPAKQQGVTLIVHPLRQTDITHGTTTAGHVPVFQPM